MLAESNIYSDIYAKIKNRSKTGVGVDKIAGDGEKLGPSPIKTYIC